jgi:hypothetical protein
MNEGTIMTVDWQINPFILLLDKVNEFSFYIHSRLCGPDTIKAVSIEIEKLDPLSFQHENKENIIIWSNYIDTNLYNEMTRENDLGIMYNKPKVNINNMNELALAIKVSKYCTHYLPTDYGFIITNPKSVYLKCVTLKNCGDVGFLSFDKDDGFTDDKFLNDKFLLWKNNNYQGDIQNFYNKY